MVKLPMGFGSLVFKVGLVGKLDDFL